VTGRRPDWKDEGTALVTARRAGSKKARRESGRMACVCVWGVVEVEEIRIVIAEMD